MIELDDNQYELVGLVKHIGNEYRGNKIDICKYENSISYEFNDNNYQINYNKRIL